MLLAVLTGGFPAKSSSLYDAPPLAIALAWSSLPVWFQDVLMALSREVHRALAEKKGAKIDLSESYRMKVQFVGNFAA